MSYQVIGGGVKHDSCKVLSDYLEKNARPIGSPAWSKEEVLYENQIYSLDNSLVYTAKVSLESNHIETTTHLDKRGNISEPLSPGEIASYVERTMKLRNRRAEYKEFDMFEIQKLYREKEGLKIRVYDLDTNKAQEVLENLVNIAKP